MQNANKILEDLLIARDPAKYAESAVLARLLAEQMLARLDLVTLQPQVIVDLGCGVGDSTVLLKNRYPDAKIIAMDSSIAMLSYAKHQHKQKADWLHVAIDNLPLPEHSVDMIWVNLLLPWCAELEIVREWRRILRPDGLFMMSALGPDTLKELHASKLHFPHLVDMHHIGDALTKAGLIDVVLDMDYFTFTYRNDAQLFQELQATGMIWGDVAEMQLEKTPEGVYPITYEVIFGHAWGPPVHADHMADEKGEVHIPISHILRRS
jgi:malonyl-CoA O-methyltransferase